MADLHKILNKLSELGIENKGLTIDNPMTQGNALKEQYGNKADVNPNSHARMVAESVAGKHIPGVSDTNASDFAALAGVSSTKPRPSPSSPNPNTYTPAPETKWGEVDARLTRIETQLQKVFESINSLKSITEGMSDDEYIAKRKALQDIQVDPNTNKDPELKKELIRRKEQLEKERKETTKESLEKGFASFLKELEGK